MKAYGKAARLVEAISSVAGTERAAEITEGLEPPPLATSPKRKATWMREVVTRMEQFPAPAQCRDTMDRRHCPISPKGCEHDRALWARAGSLEAFAQADMGVLVTRGTRSVAGSARSSGPSPRTRVAWRAE